MLLSRIRATDGSALVARSVARAILETSFVARKPICIRLHTLALLRTRKTISRRTPPSRTSYCYSHYTGTNIGHSTSS